MEARLRSWWQQIKQHRVAAAITGWLRDGTELEGQQIKQHRVAATITAFVVVMVLIFAGYWFKWDWTGFNEHLGPNVQQYQPAKTLWDWLNLLGVLAIPAVVGLGAAWYTAQQGKVSEKENKDNQYEAALQAYIDKMSELILKENLRGSTPRDEVGTIARVRTLTVLQRSDTERKRNVFLFLLEAGLIYKDKTIIGLRRANLQGVNLKRAHLSKTHYLYNASKSV